MYRQLPALRKRVADLEQRIAELEEKLAECVKPSGQLAGAFCLVIFVAASARAQPTPVSRHRARRVHDRGSISSLSSNALTCDDPHSPGIRTGPASSISSTTSYGRLTFSADYQAILGDEFRPFDPYQSNYYHLGRRRRIGVRSTEWALVFHHVSRHLGDRPKRDRRSPEYRGSGRMLKRIERRGATIDVKGDLGPVVANVLGGLHVAGQRRRHGAPSDHAGRRLYGRGFGETFGVDEDVAGPRPAVGRPHRGRREACRARRRARHVRRLRTDDRRRSARPG